MRSLHGTCLLYFINLKHFDAGGFFEPNRKSCSFNRREELRSSEAMVGFDVFGQ